MNTGNFSEAEFYLKEAYDLRRRVLGDDHPDVAITANNLGILKKDMGHLDEAAEYFEEALSLRRKVIGENISTTPYPNLTIQNSTLNPASQEKRLLFLKKP